MTPAVLIRSIYRGPMRLTRISLLDKVRFMSPSQPKPPSDSFADKRRRQAEWEKYCDDKQLSVAQRNRAASIIPPGASIKVLAWPSL